MPCVSPLFSGEPLFSARGLDQAVPAHSVPSCTAIEGLG